MPQHLFVIGMEGIEFAPVAILDNAQGLDGAHLCGIVTRPHSGNRAGVHQKIEGILFHGTASYLLQTRSNLHEDKSYSNEM